MQLLSGSAVSSYRYKLGWLGRLGPFYLCKGRRLGRILHWPKETPLKKPRSVALRPYRLIKLFSFAGSTVSGIILFLRSSSFTPGTVVPPPLKLDLRDGSSGKVNPHTSKQIRPSNAP